MTSRTAPAAPSTDVLGPTVAVGDIVFYNGSIEACHGPARIVGIIKGPTQPGALFADWTRFDLRTAGGTLCDVRPVSILTRCPAEGE